MQDNITIVGNVGTEPETFVTSGGLTKTFFRLATSGRWFDRKKGEWVDGPSNWYKVEVFRQLADNVAASVHKGQNVIVTGRLKLREWSTDEKSGTAVEIEAEAVGHNLAWGTASYSRSPRRDGLPATAGTADISPGGAPSPGWASAPLSSPAPDGGELATVPGPETPF
jgi:single-strand DNA-binding protein